MDLNIYYVDQANFTLLKLNDKVIIFDCNDRSSTWLLNNEKLRHTSERYLDSIFNDVNEVFIINSHPHRNHMNMFLAIINILKKKFNFIEIKEKSIINGKKDVKQKYYTVMKDRNDYNFINNIKKLETFFSPNFKINIYVPSKKINQKEYSIVLKIIGNFKINGYNKSNSIILTGDANKNTFYFIIENYYNDNDFENILRSNYSKDKLRILLKKYYNKNNLIEWFNNYYNNTTLIDLLKNYYIEDKIKDLLKKK